jgi:hypothetical protein
VEADGTLNVTGSTLSADFPTTPGALDRTLGGSRDAFVSRLDPTGSDLLYGTYLGGGRSDWGTKVVPAGPGGISVAGSTESADFPTTPGAFDRTYNGEIDAYVATLKVARIMHVDRIVPAYRPHGSGYRVGAGIRILYSDGSPVPGATVTVRIDLPDGTHAVATAPTGPRGIAAVSRSVSDSGTYTFTVLDVALVGSAYDPSQNGETSDSVTIP